MIASIISLLKADSTEDILMIACSKGKALKCSDYIQSVKYSEVKSKLMITVLHLHIQEIL